MIIKDNLLELTATINCTLKFVAALNIKNINILERFRSIHSLPDDLIIDIIARVAAHSLKDFINVKLSCQRWNKLSDDWSVYKHASLPTFPEWKDLGIDPSIECGGPTDVIFVTYTEGREIVSPESSEENKRKTSLFLQKCFDVENPQALYIGGVVDYFEGREPERAIGWLKKAANAGNIAARYVICIISIISGGEQDKKDGFVTLSGILKEREGRKQVRKARLQLTHIFTRRVLKNIPIRRVFPAPVCCTIPGHNISGINLTYLFRDEDEDEDNAKCLFCRCDLEISSINKILSYAGIVEKTSFVTSYVITD